LADPWRSEDEVLMDIRHRAVLLRETELFGQLDDDVLHKLADRMFQKVFERGQSIFVQDEPGDRLFIIADGGVKLLVRSRSGESIELVRHTRPAVLGELAALDSGARSATAEAVDRTTLLSLSRDDLFEVLRSEPRVVEAMLRRLTGIVRRTTQDLAALAFLDLEGRVARRILALSRAPEPIPVNRSAAKSRRVTQTEIAQMVSGSRQTVNRALRSLERRGYIELTDGSIVIRDEKSLQKRADQRCRQPSAPTVGPGVRTSAGGGM
jgi:CRP/FNR family transcriptional regulator, cyclic AMP receptor protein